MNERRLMNYRLKEPVGRGAFSEVWRAEKNGRDCALKFLRTSNGPENAQALLEALRFEFWVLKDVRHGNVVAVRDFGVTDAGEVFLEEEWLEGTDLANYCRGRDFAACEPALRGVFSGLKALHEWGIVHGDLKPENVLVVRGENGPVAKILDFGLARVTRGEKAPDDAAGVSGTPAQLAPEIILGQKADARSDLYALGVTLYECLTGSNPFARATLEETLSAHLRFVPDPLGLIRSDVPPSWGRLLGKLLAKNPAERPDDAGKALAEIGGGTFALSRGTFVGREAELKTCLDAARRALDENAPLTIIAQGPHGVGTSRFLNEVLYRLIFEDPRRRSRVTAETPAKAATIILSERGPAPDSRAVLVSDLKAPPAAEFKTWLAGVLGTDGIPEEFAEKIRRLARGLYGQAFDILTALADAGQLADAEGRVTPSSLAHADFGELAPDVGRFAATDFDAVLAGMRAKLARRKLSREDPAWEELGRLRDERASKAERSRRAALANALRGAAMTEWGDWGGAREKLAAALGWLREEKPFAAEAIRTRNYLAYALLRQGLTDESIAAYEESERLMGKLPPEESAAVANLDLGSAYLEAGRAEDAVAALGRKLAFHRERGERAPQLSPSYNLALAETKRKNFTEAARHFESTSALARELREPAFLLRALNGTGNARSRAGESEAAAAAYGEALDLALALSDFSSAAAAAQNRGSLAAKNGRYEDAGRDFETSLRLIDKVKNRHAYEKTLAARALTELGSLETRLNRLDKARERLDKAWSLAEDDSDLAPFRFWILAARCRLWRALGNGEKFKNDLARSKFEAGDDPEKREAAEELSKEGTPGHSDGEQTGRREAELTAILKANRDLIGEPDRDALLRKILSYAVEITGAELGVILVTGENGELTPAASLNADLDKDLSEVSLSVAHRALTAGVPVRAFDAVSDAEFNLYASVMALKLKSILGLPVLFQGRALGVLYLSHRWRTGLFDDDVTAVAQAFADQAGLALKTHELLEFHRKTNEDLQVELETTLSRLVIAEENLARGGEILEIDAGNGKFPTRSPKMREAVDKARRFAATAIPVIIHGESGTGKEILARYVHHASPRRGKPFVAVNCGALPSTLAESELFGHVRGAFTGADRDRTGLIEAAAGGTLFLDEIADLPVELQVKLLRALQEKEITRLGETRPRKADVRVVAASHRTLREAVSRGKFREDLYYRLAGAEVVLPALRERPEDIPLLTELFLAEFRERSPAGNPKRLSPKFLRKLVDYPWPGNVRELKNVVEASATLCEGAVLTEASLPDPLAAKLASFPPGASDADSRGWYDPRLTWQEHEVALFASALVAFDFDALKTAASLGVGVATVYKKMREHGLKEKTGGWRERARPYREGFTLVEFRKRVFLSAAKRHAGHPYRAAKELDVAPVTFYRYGKDKK